MKKPRSLKECKNDDDVEKYVIDNDGLADDDLDGVEPVYLGSGDVPDTVVPVAFDPEELAMIQKLARREGKDSRELIRELAIAGSRSRLAQKKAIPRPHESKKRARG